MKVLYYNWVDYLDDENRGGGVSVYQRNLMTELAKDTNTQTVFLSSGIAYDLPSRAPRWEQQRHGAKQDRHRRFEIVNSGVLAPAHHSFGEASQQDHPATQKTFFDFIEATGPYDVVHFNNLEGLPASALELKKRWPQTKVILSLHNYYPICPQVNLWHQERQTCDTFGAGSNCANCLVNQHDGRLLRLANGLAYRLKNIGLKPGSWAFDVAFRWTIRVGSRLGRIAGRLRGKQSIETGKSPMLSTQNRANFANRRARMVELINTNCDRVLCVSEAVHKLAKQYGLDPAITRTCYIGTREAEAFKHTTARETLLGNDGILTLGYLGYMRRDKGFFFLLDALESLPKTLAERVQVVIAARRSDKITMDRIDHLAQHLAGVHYEDGYSHEALDTLLAQVDVGVVPVLWHDNLPQVAIEMHARHIPLLTSDMGGAQELGGCADMTFTAGDIADFHARIKALLDWQVDIAAYWAGAATPVDMQSHISSLRTHYAA